MNTKIEHFLILFDKKTKKNHTLFAINSMGVEEKPKREEEEEEEEERKGKHILGS